MRLSLHIITPRHCRGGLHMLCRPVLMPYANALSHCPVLTDVRNAQVKVVSTAADAAVKAFVQLMNPQAVRVVLPDLLAALDTKKNWQTKIAALQAFSELCKRAPLQTNVCLPDIIPAVTSIMGDAKPQVKVWHFVCGTAAAIVETHAHRDAVLPMLS